MLPTKTLLSKGRYRIDHPITAGPSARLYRAYDNSAKRPIAILEFDSKNDVDFGDEGQSLVHLQHDGLVRIEDHFQDRQQNYCATEPLLDGAGISVAGRVPDEAAADAIVERLAPILFAIQALQDEFTSINHVELAPEMFLTTADGKLKLLFSHGAKILSGENRSSSPFLPLESVWESLDHINQKAIYNTYDERSLAILESPPDSRSDLYSLGAVFYRLLTGTDPMSAFERSLEMLDRGRDPLKVASELNPAVRTAAADFLSRMMELRRERRFGSIDDAILELPATPAASDRESYDDIVETEIDYVEILELPAAMPVAVRTAVPQPVVPPPVPVMPALVKTDTVADKPKEVKVTEPTMPTILAQARGPQKDRHDRHQEQEIFSGQMFGANSPNGRATASLLGGNGKLFVIAAAALVVVGAAVFGILNFGSSGAIGQSGRIETPTASVSEPSPQEPVAVQALSELPAQDVSDSTKSGLTDLSSKNADRTESDERQPSPRPQVADNKTAKRPEKKAKPEAKPKKTLTVDDLINDN